MPPIRIRHPHALPPADARARVERLATELASKHGAECRWQGNCLHFRRAGLDGSIEVDSHEVTVAARLGLTLLPLRGVLAREVENLLARHFPPA